MAPKKGDILSASHYDADASSIHTASEQASDSEDDQLLNNTQDTSNERDRSILKDEEETERLLSKPKHLDAVRDMFTSNPHEGAPVKASRREARRENRRQKRHSRRRKSRSSRSASEIMYEMEEGWKDSSSQTSPNSSSAELDKAWATRRSIHVCCIGRLHVVQF